VSFRRLHPSSGLFYGLRSGTDSWQTEEVVDGVEPGAMTAMRVIHGRPHIAYLDRQNESLYVVSRSTSGTWTTPELVDGDADQVVASVVRDGTELHLAYREGGDDEGEVRHSWRRFCP
jgi:hypothetical protein